jgi:hypothetical protein
VPRLHRGGIRTYPGQRGVLKKARRRHEAWKHCSTSILRASTSIHGQCDETDETAAGEGALREQVNKVMVDFAYSIGLFSTADLSGLDIGYDSRQRRAAQNPNYPKLPIADAIFEAGRLGQKTSAGWFRYEKGDRTPHPDPEAARIIKENAAEFGIEQRSFTGEEILRRLLFAPVNEACKILEEGKAYRASDIDVMWLNCFGFPRDRGGLMYWADGIGVAEVYPQIAACHQRHGERWAPSPFLGRVAKPAPRSAKRNPAGRCSAQEPSGLLELTSKPFHHFWNGGAIAPSRPARCDLQDYAVLDCATPSLSLSMHFNSYDYVRYRPFSLSPLADRLRWRCCDIDTRCR